jgi:arylsulfatase A-like enzyme
MHTGSLQLPKPSLGSWVVYGLGTDNQNMPGFITLGGKAEYRQAAFLPPLYQGSNVDYSPNMPLNKILLNIKNPFDDAKTQRRQLDLLAQLNQKHLEARQKDAQLEARIQSYELAYRMQTEATDAFDISLEPQHIRDMYGADKSTQARQILIARRLAERGVRYIQVWHGEGQPWDNHDDLEVNHRRLAGQCDQAIGALIKDLKQRGMLEDTLVMWGGEFGRTPTVELPTPGSNAGKINGRDHNHYGFTMWLAGGGAKGGYVHGATDDFGFKAVDKPVHVHDLHATILKLMGFDHERFTYRYAGRDFRLTDVHGNVVNEIIA